MTLQRWTRFGQFAVLILVLFVLIGYRGVFARRQTGPLEMPNAPATETLSTQLNRPIGDTRSQQPSAQANSLRLTALLPPVSVLKGDSSEHPLKRNESQSINVNDQITVGELGHALLTYGDNLMAVDIFSGTLAVSKIEPRSGGLDNIQLARPKGHTITSVNDNSNVRVTYDSDFATITTLKDDTEFVVCHNPVKVTCIVVKNGLIEVRANATGEIVQVNKGGAIYVLKGQGPSITLPVRLNELDPWFDQLIRGQKVDALSALVDRWNNELIRARAVSTPIPFIQSENMVRIPSGNFTIGTIVTDEFHVPAQQIHLEDFWIDVYLVTNAEYQKFLDATRHSPPASWPLRDKDKHPVRGVTWDDAAAYCAWVNKRLPKEAEWEVAARGPDLTPPLFPWGNDPFAGGSVDDLPIADTYEVGTFSFNQSPFHAYDMTGNVWQWVGEPYSPVASGVKIARGGRFGYIKDMPFRQLVNSADKTLVPFAGFRCAVNANGR